MNATSHSAYSQTSIEDKNKIIYYIKSEIKLGKRIPVGVKFDQEIVDSFNKESRSFDIELIEKKGESVKDYKNWIYLSSKKKKLILRTEIPLSKYIKSVLNDFENDINDNECLGDEIIRPLFSTVLEILGEIDSGKKKTFINTETAQRFIEDIVDLTIIINEESENIESWLNN